MASLNQCSFIGRLGQDPEVRFTNDGKAVASFSIACSESWKDKNTGEKVEKTEWVNISAFGKLAEIIGKYLTKGSQVYISGKMKTDKYEKDGVTKYSTKIIAREMVMLDSQNETAVKQGQSVEAQRQGVAAQKSAPENDFDDIPFDLYERKAVV